jgi:hypothetical protein
MTRVGPVTGVGITTSVGMESADLGIMRWDPQRQAIAAVFGDNFTAWRMQGDWQSPSIIMYDNDFNVLGIPTVSGIDSEGTRRQAIPYPHNNPDFTTILPCDLIRIAGVWYLAGMVTAGLGREKRTVFWQSLNLVDWEKTDPYVSLPHLDDAMRPVGHPGTVMLTFDQVGDWIYIFGTGGLSRDKPIWLWRCPADTFPHREWEPWGMDQAGGWAWGNPNEHCPILTGRYGELCFRVIQANCVLSFFDVDEYRQTALCAAAPTDDWMQANRVDYASGQDTPQLYGGYIAPGSRLDEPDGMKFWVSQWNTASNDPYHVLAFADTLAAATAVVEPEPEPEEPPVEPTTPQDTYDLLMRELAASGSTEILTADGRKLTLREAVGEIYAQECSLHSVSGTPLDPRVPAAQLDHVLSGRAENLFTQALVVAIADKLGVDAAALYTQVKASLG